MRYKFRGKRVSDGEWIFGDLLKTGYKPEDTKATLSIVTDECHFMLAGFGERALYDEVEKNRVESETVGQFTGLMDKNGKEIYEGDIYLHNKRKFIVLFTKNAGVVAIEMNKNYIHGESYGVLMKHNWRTYLDVNNIRTHIEITGNIHQPTN